MTSQCWSWIYASWNFERKNLKIEPFSFFMPIFSMLNFSGSFSCYESIWEHSELIFWIHTENFMPHFLTTLGLIWPLTPQWTSPVHCGWVALGAWLKLEKSPFALHRLGDKSRIKFNRGLSIEYIQFHGLLFIWSAGKKRMQPNFIILIIHIMIHTQNREKPKSNALKSYPKYTILLDCVTPY